jgi:hypothetical protein
VVDLRDHPATEPLEDGSEWGPVLERVIADLEAVRPRFHAGESVPELVSD